MRLSRQGRDDDHVAPGTICLFAPDGHSHPFRLPPRRKRRCCYRLTHSVGVQLNALRENIPSLFPTRALHVRPKPEEAGRPGSLSPPALFCGLASVPSVDRVTLTDQPAPIYPWRRRTEAISTDSKDYISDYLLAEDAADHNSNAQRHRTWSDARCELDPRRHVMTKSLRVLLLEDSAADADLISSEFDRAGMNVTVQCVNSKDAFARALREFQPDVVLSDHGLTQFNARAALRMVQQVRPTSPVIIVAGSLDDQAAVACLRARAETFVLKSSLRSLRPAIDAAISSRRRLELLSPRQIEVLRLVAEGNTTREIATRLHVSMKTVETHRSAILKRLGIHDVVGLVRYALRVGLVSLDV